MTENYELYRKKHLFSSIIIAVVLMACPWIIELIEFIANTDFNPWGLQPRKLSGLTGVVTMPLLHAGINHLFSNTVPLLLFIAGLFYFYPTIAWRVLLWSVLIAGVWLWVIGIKGSVHVGASGLVYALAAFHFTGGVIRQNRHLIAFAMLVIFLYGSMIWAVFPDFYPDKNISWEGHLTGLIAGVILAFVYRKEGPQPDRHWKDEEEEEDAYPGWDVFSDGEDDDV
ncbi:MAG: rhomboid family intramembrane serine protease [Bacteroidales bacterium]|nr:rhomboid family intramembrane serine protease [Bacteroidales bacterium]